MLIIDDLIDELEDLINDLDKIIGEDDGPLSGQPKINALNKCGDIVGKCDEIQTEAGQSGTVDTSNRPTTLTGQVDRIESLALTAKTASTESERDDAVATIKWYCEDTTADPSRIARKIKTGYD